MAKQYGLILPGQRKKVIPGEVSREFTRPSIFDESSSESDDNRPPQMQMKKSAMGPSLMEKRKAKNLQEKALAEDSTIFQYDELYDEMETKREEEKQIKSKEPKKARYITKLMEAAEKRKLENELRVERQVQKEREAEGEAFKDKEAFVTSAYRKKLEEMRKLEEQNKRDDYLETIGDVTKQKDLDGFYRHIYEQKTGTCKDIKKPELLPEMTNEGGIAYKPIKSGKVQTQRAYRKRKASEEEEENENDKTIKDELDKKVHLTNNIDADSDFSIDDDSSTESESDDNDKTVSQKSKSFKPNFATNVVNSKLSDIPNNTIALKLEFLKPAEPSESKSVNTNKKDNILPTTSLDLQQEKLPRMTQKRDKSEIWRKRTVGDVYIAAVERYYERKEARNRA